MSVSEKMSRLMRDSQFGIKTPTPWNWNDESVQADTDASSTGGFISADSTLICVGPPKLPSDTMVLKLGLTPNFSYSSHIPKQRVTEIGSKRVHIIKGTPVGGGSISRLLYNGPTLLCMSYGLIFDENGLLPSVQALFDNGKDLAEIWRKKTESMIFKEHLETNFWLSCWDERLDFPIGFAVFSFDLAGNRAGGVYFEGVKYDAHNVSKQASQLVMAETLNFSFDRMVPIA